MIQLPGDSQTLPSLSSSLPATDFKRFHPLQHWVNNLTPRGRRANLVANSPAYSSRINRSDHDELQAHSCFMTALAFIVSSQETQRRKAKNLHSNAEKFGSQLHSAHRANFKELPMSNKTLLPLDADQLNLVDGNYHKVRFSRVETLA